MVIYEQRPCGGQRREETGRGTNIAALPKRELEDDQEPLGVDNRVDCRRATAATAADGLLLGSPFSPAATGVRFQGCAIGVHDVGRSVPHQ